MDAAFASKRVTVMGLGRFGGGVGAARFLAERGARVTVTDLNRADELAESVMALDDLPVRYVLGRHELSDFTEAQLVVVNPAVPRTSPFVEAARAAGTPMTTEIGLFVERCPAPICGITGSNGKSTTVSLLGAILEAAGEPHHVGGNLGGSLLAELPAIRENDKVVLEISSFQLEWLDELGWSPALAAVMNVLPNHLDRHGTYENYMNIKGMVLDHQKSGDVAVLVRDDHGARSLADRARCRVFWVGENLIIPSVTTEKSTILRRSWRMNAPILDVADLCLPGRHNRINAMVAVACALEMGIAVRHIQKGLVSFTGLPHRLEYVGKRDDVRFFNDSKATTPEAAAAGVLAFSDEPGTVIPIFGGSDKGVSFDGLAASIAEHVSWAALIGVTAGAIGEAFAEHGIEAQRFQTLEEAVAACAERADFGDVVLLSPGCASYDMFANFTERGDAFRRCARKLGAE